MTASIRPRIALGAVIGMALGAIGLTVAASGVLSSGETAPTASAVSGPTASPVPSVTSTATPRPHPSPTLPAPPAPVPVVSPSLDGVQVFDYTGGAVPPAVERQWAMAALRSDALRLYSVATARLDVATALFAPSVHGQGVATAGLLPLVEQLAAAGRSVTMSGTAGYVAVGVYALEPAQRTAFTQRGFPVPLYAVMLTITGPVTASNGHLTAALAPADGALNVLLPGELIHDPWLGDIWRASYAQQCSVGDPATSLLCTGH